LGFQVACLLLKSKLNLQTNVGTQTLMTSDLSQMASLSVHEILGLIVSSYIHLAPQPIPGWRRSPLCRVGPP
jgi:hypothetical protein